MSDQTPYGSTLKHWLSQGQGTIKEMSSSVSDAKRAIIDENAYRYGGMTSKAYRNKIRQQRVGTPSAAGAGAHGATDGENDAAQARVVAEDPKYVTDGGAGGGVGGGGHRF